MVQLEMFYLREYSPEDAEPPQLHCQEDSTQDVAESNGENVSNDILNGVTWQCFLDFKYFLSSNYYQCILQKFQNCS